MRKIALSLIMMVAICLHAKQTYDFRLDGVYYRIDLGQKNAYVAKGDDPYAGEVVIPERIESTEGEFTVVGIDPKAFVGSKTMTSVAYAASLTSIGEGAFQGCESLKQFTISPNITFIANSAFENSGLEEITIPQSVVNIGDNVFKGCKGLQHAVIENKQISENQFANCSALTSVTIEENVVSIKKKAFSRCSNLVTIAIPQSVTKLEAEIFTGCEKLQVADIRNCTIAAKQFAGCKQLSQISLTEELTLIEEKAFSGCVALAEFKTPAKLQVIRDEAFLNCSGLKVAELGSSLTHIGKKAFAGTAVEQLHIPASIKTFGDATFEKCKQLQAVVIDNALLSEGEFQGCEQLAEIVFNAVPHRIPKNAFNGCAALTLIPLPEGITVIESNAFHGCKLVTELTIPSTVEQIGTGAFGGCAALNHIRCLAVQVPVTGSSAFSGIAKEGIKIEVPAIALEAYKLAAGWKQLQPKEGQVFFAIE